MTEWMLIWKLSERKRLWPTLACRLQCSQDSRCWRRGFPITNRCFSSQLRCLATEWYKSISLFRISNRKQYLWQSFHWTVLLLLVLYWCLWLHTSERLQSVSRKRSPMWVMSGLDRVRHMAHGYDVTSSRQSWILFPLRIGPFHLKLCGTDCGGSAHNK